MSSDPREQCHPGCTKTSSPTVKGTRKHSTGGKGAILPAGNGKHGSPCQPTTLTKKNRLLTNLLEENQLFSSPWNKNHYNLSIHLRQTLRTLFYYFTDSFWWKSQKTLQKHRLPFSTYFHPPCLTPQPHCVSSHCRTPRGSAGQCSGAQTLEPDCLGAKLGSAPSELGDFGQVAWNFLCLHLGTIKTYRIIIKVKFV